MIKFTANAELINVNCGHEGSGDGKIARADLRVKFPSTATLLKTLLGLPTGKNKIFWRDNGDQLPLGKVTISSEFKHCDVSYFGKALEDCTIKNISIEPVSGNAMLVGCTIQFRRPTGGIWKTFAESQRDTGELIVQSNPDLFGAEEEDDADSD